MTTKLDLGELYRVRLNREREKRKLASEKGNMPKEPEFSAAKHRKLAQGSSSTGDRDGDREKSILFPEFKEISLLTTPRSKKGVYALHIG